MLGDVLQEELDYELDKKLEAQVIETVNWASRAKITIEQEFYVIGFNEKTKTYICKKVRNKNEAYEIVTKNKLNNYVFAENVFKKFNMED